MVNASCNEAIPPSSIGVRNRPNHVIDESGHELKALKRDATQRIAENHTLMENGGRRPSSALVLSTDPT